MQILYLLPGAFFAPIIHGWVKAALSEKLGDPTPRNKGFLPMKPLRYFEPIGFVLILIFGFGWGQPVPTSPLHYKERRNGVLLTHLTPSVVSLLVGVVAAAFLGVADTLLYAHLITPATPGWQTETIRTFIYMLHSFAKVNVGMAFFSLIPVHPLNGTRILQLYLKPEHIAKMNQYEKIFQVILIILLVLGVVNMLISPIVDNVVNLHTLTRRWM
jgi:Zn-dependent protease